jgi:hypothetical protein
MNVTFLAIYSLNLLQLHFPRQKLKLSKLAQNIIIYLGIKLLVLSIMKITKFKFICPKNIIM